MKSFNLTASFYNEIEPGSQKKINLPKITQLVSSRAKTRTHVFWLPVQFSFNHRRSENVKLFETP